MYNSGRDLVCLNPATVCRQHTKNRREMKILQEKRSHRKKRTYQCQICNTGYASETDMEVHKVTHKEPEHFEFLHDPDSTTCRACLQVMDDQQQLLEHFKVVHLLSDATSRRVKHEIFICDVCERLFFSKSLLTLHLRRHRVRHAEYECPRCDAMVKERSVIPHLERHLAGRVGTCPICLGVFVTKTEMLKHVRAAHRPWLACETCGYTASQHAHFLAHLDNVHALEPADDEEEVEVELVKIFAPSSHEVPSNFKYFAPIPINGVLLAGSVSVCVLCREVCATAADRRRHAAACHPPRRPAPPRARRRCRCGEEFDSNILLRHHIFRSPGDHGLVKEEPPVKEE